MENPYKKIEKIEMTVGSTSVKVKIGRTLQTRDNFLEDGKGYNKPGYENKGHYRRVAVVDTNKKNELAVTKLYGHSGTPLPNYEKGKSRYKNYILTKDDSGKPIKVGKKFKLNSKNKNLTKKDINTIKKDALVNSPKSIRQLNKTKLRKLKGRK